MATMMQTFDRFNTSFEHEIKNYLSTYDFMMQNYYEILMENKRRDNASQDIDNLKEQQSIYRSIYEIINVSQEKVRQNLHLNFDLLGAPTYSMQVSMYNNTRHLSDQKETMAVPQPFIDTSSDRTTEIKVNSLVNLGDKSKLLGLLWAFSFELFKEPKEGFYAANLLKYSLFANSDYTKYAKVEPSEKNRIIVTFPLRVEPAEEKLEDFLKCAKVKFENGDIKSVVYRKYLDLRDFRSN